MSNDALQHGEHHQGPEFEREDWSPKAVYGFLAGLAFICLLVYFVIRGLYAYLDAYEQKRQPAQNPLVTATTTNTRVVTPEEVKTFPQPRLEVDERGQINGFRLEEEQKLHSYGWVDQKAGVVRIPIDRAMDLIAQRGLPTSPQKAAESASPAKQKKK
jgi:hypothetical protein